MAGLLFAKCLLLYSTSFLKTNAFSGRIPTLSPSPFRTMNRSLLRRNMFSGIVEEIGTVESLQKNSKLKLWDGSIGEGTELVVRSKGVVLDGAYLGASISVNGVCTTVVEYDSHMFKVGLAPETLRRSNLGSLKPNDFVNLERGLAVNSRNSGHFVQGHVDCTGEILNKQFEDDSLWIKVSVPKDMMKYIVPKGFIAIDGTSLTVCEVDTMENWFTFMMVSFTQSKVIIPFKEQGDLVNLEVDVLGKYVERSLEHLNKRVEALENIVSDHRNDSIIKQ